jgi:hypothetical protein
MKGLVLNEIAVTTCFCGWTMSRWLQSNKDIDKCERKKITCDLSYYLLCFLTISMKNCVIEALCNVDSAAYTDNIVLSANDLLYLDSALFAVQFFVPSVIFLRAVTTHS